MTIKNNDIIRTVKAKADNIKTLTNDIRNLVRDNECEMDNKGPVAQYCSDIDKICENIKKWAF
jgi:hypothetical protein